MNNPITRNRRYDGNMPIDAGRVNTQVGGIGGVSEVIGMPPVKDDAPLLPPIAPPRKMPEPPNYEPDKKPQSELEYHIEIFKQNYTNTFGFDSIIPSSKDVHQLNILFAIFSELVSIREALEKNK